MRALAILSLFGCSSLYRAVPVDVAEQPDFVNAVCAIDTAPAPEALMHQLLEIERQHGRRRGTPRGSPCALDLDLLLSGNLRLDTPELTLPHPRLHERAFVLYPLSEIVPGLEVPGRGAVAVLRAGCVPAAIERRAEDETKREIES